MSEEHDASPPSQAGRPSEAPVLTALTIRSKAHWGYSDSFMTAAIPELKFCCEKFLPEFLVHVLQEDGKRMGFGSLLRMDDDTVELHETVWVPRT